MKNPNFFWINLCIYLSKNAFFILVTFLLFIIATGQTFSNSYSPADNLSLSFKDTPVVQVFNEIEKQSDFNIFYKVDQIDVHKKISINVKDQLLSELLDDILSEHNVSYTVLDKIIVIRGENSQQEQTGWITGNVTDSDTGEPIPGVNIIIKGTNLGTISDAVQATKQGAENFLTKPVNPDHLHLLLKLLLPLFC